jgi:hypothetical protein
MRSWLASFRLVICPLLVAAFSNGAEAHQREEQGDVWVMTLDSQENTLVATAIANALGRIPKPGSVFDTIARVMLVTDAVGGGRGTETFGVGTAVIATLPRGSNLWGAIKAATEKIGRENQKDAREAAVQRLALQWLKQAGNSGNANVIANRLRFGNHIEQIVQERDILDRDVLIPTDIKSKLDALRRKIMFHGPPGVPEPPRRSPAPG